MRASATGIAVLAACSALAVSNAAGNTFRRNLYENRKGQKASGVLSGRVDADWICNAGV